MTSDSETKGLTTLCTGLNMQPYTNGSTILILLHTKSQWVTCKYECYKHVQLPTILGGIYTMSNYCFGSCYQTSSVTHVRTVYIYSVRHRITYTHLLSAIQKREKSFWCVENCQKLMTYGVLNEDKIKTKYWTTYVKMRDWKKICC